MENLNTKGSSIITTKTLLQFSPLEALGHTKVRVISQLKVKVVYTIKLPIKENKIVPKFRIGLSTVY
jgi:hypothetical protein